MCTYISIINSIIIGSAVLQDRFHFSEERAGFFFTLPYVISAVCSPILGWFVDKYGKRMSVTLIGAGLMVAAHTYNVMINDCD
jgi:MFS family permease